MKSALNPIDALFLGVVAAMLTYLPATELRRKPKPHREPSVVRALAWLLLAVVTFVVPVVPAVLVHVLTHYHYLVTALSFVAALSNVAGVLLGIALIMRKWGGTVRLWSVTVALVGALLLALATVDVLVRQPGSIDRPAPAIVTPYHPEDLPLSA